MTATITGLELDLPKVATGKVREVFDAGEHLLMVATDRVSVYDVVLPTSIPDKGAVLTGLSVFWFERTRHIIGNHYLDHRLVSFPEGARIPELAGRSMLVRRAEMLPVECVVRGYLAGSGWADYQRAGEVCGVRLPEGLREADRLPEPIFTPAAKAATGHDENIDMEAARTLVGDPGLLERAREASLALYAFGHAHAAECGIVLADTKFEFGLVDGELVLCDEALTPDSSRYWPADEWEPGRNPPSFDKQYVRDHAASVGWDKTPPGPALPTEVVEGTRGRYREAFERLTDSTVDAFVATS
ncbi:MAG TPA: phosphoribosylaminoimidazolesuccinocarboxamide synthase [Actinomycetota bacterium]|nr:phosphoribosylaminoimidazolesuccinocarboxamide synthase [Actinomycetota bacterium]